MAKMKIEGIEELLQEISKLEKKGASIENRVFREAGKVVEDEIKNEAPIRLEP